jgi:hypothetical protein
MTWYEYLLTVWGGLCAVIGILWALIRGWEKRQDRKRGERWGRIHGR